MIPTLGRGLLYQVHRNRCSMQVAMEKRKAFWLVVGITVALTVATYFFLIYG